MLEGCDWLGLATRAARYTCENSPVPISSTLSNRAFRLASMSFIAKTQLELKPWIRSIDGG